MDDTDQTKNPNLKPISANVEQIRQYATQPISFGQREVNVDELFNN